MNVEEQIKKHIASQPEPKRSDMRQLHRLTLQVSPECKLWFDDGKDVLVQPEVEKRRSPLVGIPPFGRGFSRHGGLSIRMGVFGRRKNESSRPRFIGSMSPPGYPSAWLHPGRARLRFTRQVHCSSAARYCSQLPAYP